METLLKDFLLIFGLATGVLLLCHRLKLATTVGLLLTGVLVGPNGFGLISATHEVEILAEIGVVLLLFTIGVEFSLEGLLRIKKYVIFGGASQVLLTILFSFSISRHFGVPFGGAVFVGFLVSLSSTAIVLRVIQQRAEIESPYGQMSLAILIFQDIIVIPMMLLTPLLSGTTGQAQEPVAQLVLKASLLILLALAGAKWIVPQVLYQIARTRSRELFMLSILVICFAAAFLTNLLGLSLALGAFMAGLIISETEFSSETLGNIIPFRDVFTSLFFISIGMLLDVKFLVLHPGQVTLIVFVLMLSKSLIVCLVVLIMGFPIRTGILTGLALCQVGEFSFVLFLRGAQYGLLEARFYQLFLTVSIITMGVTPFGIALAPRLGDLVSKWPLPRKLKTGFSESLKAMTSRKREKLKDHLVIVGFGFNGRNLARAAKAVAIPYVIIEMNPKTVKDERKKGEPIFYGDATQESVLEQADVKDARIAVIVISDPLASSRITVQVRKENPKAFIIVRTRFVTEMKNLYRLGADQVIPEEFETSIEIFSRVLARYLIPRNEIEGLIAQVRADGYEMFRTLPKDPASLPDLRAYFSGLEVNTFRVMKGAPVEGKSLRQLDLRKKYGINLLAVQRDRQVLPNPDADTLILARDLLVVLARPADLTSHCGLFLNPASEKAYECDLSSGDQQNT
jgi:CPA2 family monovalent cation:H+ antiporter-2